MGRRLHLVYAELPPERQRQVLDLYQSNRGLAFSTLIKFARRTGRDHLRDDFEWVALGALWKAALGFDPARGIKFSTYACRCVWSDLKRELPSLEAPYYVPKWAAEGSRKKGLPPHCPPCQLRLDAGFQSLTANGYGSGHGALPSSREPAPEQRLLDAEQQTLQRRALARALAQLSQRERLLLRLRFDLAHTGRVPTLQAVCRRLGVTREAGRQIQLRALKRLKGLLAESEEALL